MIVSDKRSPSPVEQMVLAGSTAPPGTPTQSGLTFDEQRHIYRIDGEWVPSVSKVLRDSGIAPDFAGIDPAVLEKARNRGVAVHALTEAIDAGEHPAIPDELAGYIKSYRAFCRESHFDLVTAELMVGHKELGFAGRMDRLGWMGSDRTILDIKCVATVAHQSTAVQLGAYAGAYEYTYPTQPVQNIMAVQLRPDGTYRIYPYSLAEGWRVFQAALIVAQWRRAHK